MKFINCGGWGGAVWWSVLRGRVTKSISRLWVLGVGTIKRFVRWCWGKS